MAAEGSALKFFCQSFVLFLSQVICLRVSAAHLSHISSWPDPCWRHGAERKRWLLANRLDHWTHIYKEKLSWDGINFSSWAFFPPRTAQIHVLRCTHLECQGPCSRSVSHHALCCFKHQPLRINSAAFTAKQTCWPSACSVCLSPVHRPCHIACLQLPSHLHPSSPRAASCPGSFRGSSLPSSWASGVPFLEGPSPATLSYTAFPLPSSHCLFHFLIFLSLYLFLLCLSK